MTADDNNSDTIRIPEWLVLVGRSVFPDYLSYGWIGCTEIFFFGSLSVTYLFRPEESV